MVLSFYRAMSATDGARPEAGAWFVEADHVSVTALARRRWRARMYDERAKSGRVFIVSALFLTVIAATLMVGGHAAIDPLLQSAMAEREPTGTGDIVMTMPDGMFCRHLSFDNVTAAIKEGAIEHCPDDIARNRPRSGNSSNRGFAWRTGD
jgi:hypothetical protein